MPREEDAELWGITRRDHGFGPEREDATEEAAEMRRLAGLVLFCCATVLAGCGGGSWYDMHYDGTWTDSEGQSGSMILSYESGAVAGTVTNTTTGQTAPFSGTWDKEQQFSIAFTYPGGAEERWSGTMGSYPITGTLQRTRGSSPSGNVTLTLAIDSD